MIIANMEIGTRLSAGFGLVMLLIALMAGIGMRCLQIFCDLTDRMIRDALAKARIFACGAVPNPRDSCG